MTHNPFDAIESKLDRIESLLTGLNNTKERPTVINEVADFIPVQQIFGKYCSKATFYSHVKAGRVKLHKFGNRSFVRQDEFFASFKKVNLCTNLNQISK